MSRPSKKIAMDGSGELASNPFGALDAVNLPLKPAPASKPAAPSPKKAKLKGRVEIRREKAGRGGKTVTTLREFPSHIPLGELDRLTFDLKKACACGGTLKVRVIELQGDVRARVLTELTQRGYSPVSAGG
ncbi:MAG: translation initiation factor 1 [Lentimonas sp.]|jgi:translation initiation factor 1